VATWRGFVYVAFVIDVFSRRIVGWRVSRLTCPLKPEPVILAGQSPGLFGGQGACTSPKWGENGENMTRNGVLLVAMDLKQGCSTKK
jgi:hypothetical protein